MPAKFREELGEVFYATKGIDETISVMSAEDFQALREKISQLPTAQTKDLNRFLFSSACELVPDKNGRVVDRTVNIDGREITHGLIRTL